jgi:hypothetical protein
MKLLLRHGPSGLFYAGPDQWTETRTEALDFRATDLAMDFVSESQLKHMEVVLDFGDPGFEVPLKIAGLGR